MPECASADRHRTSLYCGYNAIALHLQQAHHVLNPSGSAGIYMALAFFQVDDSGPIAALVPIAHHALRQGDYMADSMRVKFESARGHCAYHLHVCFVAVNCLASGEHLYSLKQAEGTVSRRKGGNPHSSLKAACLQLRAMLM